MSKGEFYFAYVIRLEVDGKVSNFMLFSKLKTFVRKWVSPMYNIPLVMSNGAIPYGETFNGQHPVHLASGVRWTLNLPGVKKARFKEEVLQKLCYSVLFETIDQSQPESCA
jgi:hypothetical protein